MAKLILLNGAMNAGKTTVGRRLQELCDNIAFVELDDLHGFVPWMEIERAVPINIINGLKVTETFINEGIDVLFAYPLSDGDFEYIKTLITFDCEIIPITLKCDVAINTTNRGTRVLDEEQKERVKWMHENGLAEPSFSRVVENSNLSVEETVEEVVRIGGLRFRDEN